MNSSPEKGQKLGNCAASELSRAAEVDATSASSKEFFYGAAVKITSVAFSEYLLPKLTTKNDTLSRAQ